MLFWLSLKRCQKQEKEVCKMNSQLVVFGSARVDAFLDLPDDKAETSCNLDDRKCVLELSYSSKIPLNNVDFLVGGNGANVAVGLGRLGLKSTLVAEIGVGVLADYTKTELEKEIDTTFVTQTENVKQGFGAVIRYRGERTILSYYSPQTPTLPDSMCNSPWAYLTSTGEDFEDYYEQIFQWIGKCSPRLAFNPGGRQISKGLDWLKKYLEITELLIVNREEAEEIVGLENTHGQEKDLLDALKQTGPKKVIVTDGMNGTFATDGSQYWHAGVFPIEATERTGAGDAFSTGSIAALVSGKTLPESLVWGTVNATSVVQEVGPQPGLLNKEQLNQWLERFEGENIELKSI